MSASVRDLEKEGALPESHFNGDFSVLSSIISMRGDIKRLNEVVAGLAAKVRALEAEIRPTLEVKGKFITTGGVDE